MSGQIRLYVKGRGDQEEIIHIVHHKAVSGLGAYVIKRYQAVSGRRVSLVSLIGLTRPEPLKRD